MNSKGSFVCLLKTSEYPNQKTRPGKLNISSVALKDLKNFQRFYIKIAKGKL